MSDDRFDVETHGKYVVSVLTDNDQLTQLAEMLNPEIKSHDVVALAIANKESTGNELLVLLRGKYELQSKAVVQAVNMKLGDDCFGGADFY